MADTATITIAQRLRALYELQLIDSQIDEISIMKGELPMEVQDLEDDIAGLETRIGKLQEQIKELEGDCLLYTSPSPRDATLSRMPSSA